MDVIVFDDGEEADLSFPFSQKHLDRILDGFPYMIWSREVYERIQKHKATHIDH